METLEKLFGSVGRVKIMRLFLFHPNRVFTSEEVKKKTKILVGTCRKELNLLQKIGFVEQRDVVPEEDPVKKQSQKQKKKSGYKLSFDFPFIDQFRSIFISTETLERESIPKKLSSAGKLKLVIVSGVFLGYSDSRLDLLVVGNKINKRVLEGSIRALEAEIGKELVYAVLDAHEYNYRLQVHDRLVRDVLDYPHEVLVDKI